MHSSSFYWRSWTIGRCLHQTWTVLIFLYGRRGYRGWFGMLSLGFSDSILSVSYSGYKFKTLFIDVTVSECIWEHSLCIWVGMWCLLDIYVDSELCFLHFRCLRSRSTSCEYVRYSGIVRTMPTYTIWPLDIWSGSLFSDLYDFDFVLTFGYCGERTTFALLLHLTEF